MCVYYNVGEGPLTNVLRTCIPTPLHHLYAVTEYA